MAAVSHSGWLEETRRPSCLEPSFAHGTGAPSPQQAEQLGVRQPCFSVANACQAREPGVLYQRELLHVTGYTSSTQIL